LLEPVAEGEDAGFIDFLGRSTAPGANPEHAGGREPDAGFARDGGTALHYVKQDGSQVFKYAVRKMYESCRDLLARNGLTGEDVAVMIPHQANIRIINAAGERLGIAPEKVVINIDRYGNTTAGTIR